MIIDKIRDIEEFERLYHSRPMQTDVYDLGFIVNNPHLYCFYDEVNGALLGFIFITEDEGKLFLSGVSVEKNLKNIIDAINTVCDSYKCDIYSDTDLRHAAFVLRRAGFEKFSDNIYIRRCNNGQRQSG